MGGHTLNQAPTRVQQLTETMHKSVADKVARLPEALLGLIEAIPSDSVLKSHLGTLAELFTQYPGQETIIAELYGQKLEYWYGVQREGCRLIWDHTAFFAAKEIKAQLSDQPY